MRYLCALYQVIFGPYSLCMILVFHRNQLIVEICSEKFDLAQTVEFEVGANECQPIRSKVKVDTTELRKIIEVNFLNLE